MICIYYCFKILSLFKDRLLDHVNEALSLEKSELLDSLGLIENFCSTNKLQKTNVPDESTSIPNISIPATLIYDFFQVIEGLNEYTLLKKPYGLASSLRNIYLKDYNQKRPDCKKLYEVWDIILGITAEFIWDDGKDRSTPREGGFYSIYSKEQLEDKLIHFTRLYLERTFIKELKQFVHSRYPTKSTRNIKDITGYLKRYLKAMEDMQEDVFKMCQRDQRGYPIWAMIYCLMRSGMHNEVLDYIKTIDGLKRFENYYIEYIEQKLSEKSLKELKVEFQTLKMKSQDPYHKCVYNLLGKFDHESPFIDQEHEFIFEDYAWFNLCMISTEPQQGTGSKRRYTLVDFQNKLLSYEPSYFGDSLDYFKLLLLSLQFDNAMKYLESTKIYKIDALHFAIVLNYYGITIALKKQVTSQHHKEDIESYFALLLRQYISQLRDPRIAAHYVFLIKNSETKKLAYRDLIVDTKEFDKLLTPDLNTNKPFLLQFVSEEEWYEIIRKSAISFEERGDYQYALQLFDLCHDYFKVIDILIKQLSVILTHLNNPERQKTLDLAVMIGGKYKNIEIAEGPSKRSWDNRLKTFNILVRLTTFFDEFRLENYQGALEIISNMNLIPTKREEIEDKVVSFHNLSDSIKRNFPDILLATVHSCYALYIQLNQEKMDDSKKQFFDNLKLHVQSLVSFAGMLQYRMPQDVHIELAKIEANMI